MYELGPFRHTHLFQIAPYLRDEDCIEATALGKDVGISLEYSIRNSTGIFTIFLKESPVGFFGYSERENKNALIWMVGTSDLTKYPLAFCKKAQVVINNLLKNNSRLFNIVHRGNTVHIDWLKAMGAELSPACHPDFIQFQITR